MKKIKIFFIILILLVLLAGCTLPTGKSDSPPNTSNDAGDGKTAQEDAAAKTVSAYQTANAGSDSPLPLDPTDTVAPGEPTYTPFPTYTSFPTHTPFPTYTPAGSPSPTTDCLALAAFLAAMDTPASDYDRHLDQWNRWMKHTYEESVPPVAIGDRLDVFRSDLGEIRDQVSKMRPPRDARSIHELFLKMMVEEERAIELVQGCYTTRSERLR